jgi:hypothetical protein
MFDRLIVSRELALRLLVQGACVGASWAIVILLGFGLLRLFGY